MALLSMGFSRQEYRSGLPFPSPGDLPDPGVEPGSPELQADTLLSEPPRKPGGLGCHFLFMNFAFLYINIKYTQTPQRMTWNMGCTQTHTQIPWPHPKPTESEGPGTDIEHTSCQGNAEKHCTRVSSCSVCCL